MKKLVTILGSIGLIATTGITVVACKMPIEIKSKLEKPRKDHNPKNLDETKEHIENKANNNSNEQDVQSDEPNIKEHKTEKPEEEKQNELNSNNGENQTSNENGRSGDSELQGDEPIQNGKMLEKTKEQNFELIKKYGSELSEILNSLGDKVEEINSNEESSKLKVGVTLVKFYQNIMNYSSFSDFERNLREKLKEESVSIEEFINKIEKDWQEVIDQYSKEKQNILRILKSYKES
ncbi:lipoprotein [Mycoplasma feriruminatoris]|uniref:Lipoprotein n=1 Tax=Mycoplasma feriruminatoris TaxID=1179777 RepID=A0A654INL0_9MOLU|nr:hypothetical protein MF5583_00600 [Mycoplasma feriruminatoris]